MWAAACRSPVSLLSCRSEEPPADAPNLPAPVKRCHGRLSMVVHLPSLAPQVSEEPPVDDPDLSIRAERLIDDGPGEIKTVVADSTMYTSGKKKARQFGRCLHTCALRSLGLVAQHANLQVMLHRPLG